MNLNNYDKVEINYNTTWVDPMYKKLYSRELEYHPYYTFLKRYNPKIRNHDYYIALFDEIREDVVCHDINTKKGVMKLNLKPIWYNTSLVRLNKKIIISLTIEEKYDNGIIYYIDI